MTDTIRSFVVMELVECPTCREMGRVSAEGQETPCCQCFSCQGRGVVHKEVPFQVAFDYCEKNYHEPCLREPPE